MMFNECNGTGARDAMVYVVDDEASVRRALARLILSAASASTLPASAQTAS